MSNLIACLVQYLFLCTSILSRLPNVSCPVRTSNIACCSLKSLSYRIAGNFCEVQIFAIFATHDQNAEPRNTKLRKFEHVNFWKFLSRAFSALVLLDLMSDDGTIALFQTDGQRPTLSHGTSFVLR